MRNLRLALFLALVAMLDLGGSPLPGGAETFEEMEEAAHGRRRLVRLASQPAPPSADGELVSAAPRPPRLARDRTPAGATLQPPRKTPALSSDPASPTDDH
jgi:hypothetical protein